jgi:pyruvate/2-oxoglutarate dehydrogenase complex dihydrolipoamide acyltransferase (E2) component
MEEATIVKWHAQPGKPFRSGDVLYEIAPER